MAAPMAAPIPLTPPSRTFNLSSVPERFSIMECRSGTVYCSLDFALGTLTWTAIGLQPSRLAKDLILGLVLYVLPAQVAFPPPDIAAQAVHIQNTLLD